MARQTVPEPENNVTYVRIIRSNFRNEQKTLCPRAVKSRHALRRRDEDIPDRVNIRLAYAHDADTILNSNAYARYIDKTRLFFMLEDDHVTQRVLHVQFVAKIARTIARCLSLNEDLAEAISLALDVGQAPFGVAGQRFLTAQLQRSGVGVFRHPVQSVRVLDLLERDGAGLNLTLQVLDGVLGHECPVDGPILQPAEDTSFDAFDEACRRGLQQSAEECPVTPATLEGCLVRISELISYVARDMEDAIAVKLIRRDDLPKDVRRLLGESQSDIINNLVMNIIKNSHEKEHIEFGEEIFGALQSLREFNDLRIYRSEWIRDESDRLGRVFEQLFEGFLDDLDQGEPHCDLYRLPEEYLTTTPPGRIVCDFIAGMTDRQLVEQLAGRFLPRTIGRTFRKRANGGGM
jgi:dGTPase